MKKSYVDRAEKRLGNDSEHGNKKVHPQELARLALVDAEFSTRTRNEFFDRAFGDIMVDYFEAWLQTEPHENKTREHLYSCMLALGDVKRKLVGYEVYGRNVPHLEETTTNKEL